MLIFDPLKIKILRKSQYMTQGQLAAVIMPKHGNRQYISQLERGISLPSVEALCRLANYFRVPMDYLFANTETRITLTKWKPKDVVITRLDIERACPKCGCTGEEVV